jgi:hypothetical protein
VKIGLSLDFRFLIGFSISLSEIVSPADLKYHVKLENFDFVDSFKRNQMQSKMLQYRNFAVDADVNAVDGFVLGIVDGKRVLKCKTAISSARFIALTGLDAHPVRTKRGAPSGLSIEHADLLHTVTSMQRKGKMHEAQLRDIFHKCNVLYQSLCTYRTALDDISNMLNSTMHGRFIYGRDLKRIKATLKPLPEMKQTRLVPPPLMT